MKNDNRKDKHIDSLIVISIPIQLLRLKGISLKQGRSERLKEEKDR